MRNFCIVLHVICALKSNPLVSVIIPGTLPYDVPRPYAHALLWPGFMDLVINSASMCGG